MQKMDCAACKKRIVPHAKKRIVPHIAVATVIRGIGGGGVDISL